MRFVLSLLLALSPVAHAELLGKGEASEANPASAGRTSKEANKSAVHQAPRPLVDSSMAGIVRQRIPPPILIGRYCATEARSCVLRGRALLIGSACRCGAAAGKVTASVSGRNR